MSGLHGPDAFLEPVKQWEIIGGAPKEGLAKVNVGLNKTRQNGASPGINRDIGRFACLPGARNATVADA